MFGLAWDRWFVLLVAALFVMGPERLPAAAQWLGSAVRRLKATLSDAQARLHAEVGPELAELQKPFADLHLNELRKLRNPRSVVTDLLFSEPTPPTPAPEPAPRQGPRLPPGSRPPIDPDAT